MKRKNLPAWQQVVVTVLNSMYSVKNGHEAWDKLTEEEQTAVNNYLTEYCGDEAQAKLEETCSMMKHSRWVVQCWTTLLVVAFIAAWIGFFFWLRRVLNRRVTLYSWLLICPINMYTAWHGNPAGKARQIWEDYMETRVDAASALNRMHLAYTAPRKERMNKGSFYLWLVLWLLYIGMMLLDVLT